MGKDKLLEFNQSKLELCHCFAWGVDLGYLIWHHNQFRGSDIELMYRKCLRKLNSFVKHILATGNASVILISTPLPTVKKYTAVDSISSARASISASLNTRMRQTLRFNHDIEQWANYYSNRIHYINLDNDLLDTNGLVKDKFARPNDHHYKPEEYAKLLGEKIRKIIPLSPT